MMQARADVHLHSKFSDRPSEWILRRIGSPESFTEPHDIYKRCIQRGMDFVTISDHNCIDGALSIAHLPNTFISCEVTTYFPEDGAKMHCLVMGIDEEQFARIQELRTNIYDFRNYVVDHDIIYSLAHPLFRVNDRVSPDHIEKLILLFNRFEGINGTRDPRASELVNTIFRQLTPGMIERLADKHDIEPIGPRPWDKCFTGGSDDHGGVYIASAYTATPPANTTQEFLSHIRKGNHEIGGDSGGSVMLAHSFYHIAWAYYRKRILAGSSQNASLLGEFFNRLLTRPQPSATGLAGRAKDFVRKAVTRRRTAHLSAVERNLIAQFTQLFAAVSHDVDLDMPPQLTDKQTFELASKITDQLSYSFVQNFIEHARSGNLLETLQTIASLGPVAISISPYLAAMATQHKDEQFLQNVARRFEAAKHLQHRSQRRAWLTDTFTDINGVAKTISEMATIASDRHDPLTIVTSLQDPPQVSFELKNFKPVGRFSLPEYDQQVVAVPPVLEMMEYLESQRFSQLIISTPGPLGMIGLAAARLLGLHTVGIYHTDFPQYVHQFTQDGSLEHLTTRYMAWFYDQLDIVYAPSNAYRTQLMDMGLAPEKLRIFRRGVDVLRFHPHKRQATFWQDRGLNPGFVFIYVGRISEEKNLQYLLNEFRSLHQTHPNAKLAIVGDGPQLRELRADNDHPAIVFTGALHDEELAAAFASSDTFVFPSLTDTFGNVVLEALSSGIPAIVTHKGGPQETVQHNVTGYVVDTTQPFAMRDAMAKLVAEPVTTQQMSSHARDAALQCDWATVYNDLWDTLDIHPPSPADGGHFTERSNAAVRHTASLLQSK